MKILSNQKKSLEKSPVNTDNASFLNSTFRLKDFFKITLNLGPKIIVVTDGANGVYAATKEKIYHCESLKIKNVVNTLGAGDAFSSTFCANIYKSKSIEEAMKYALINSSYVIQHSDAKTGLQDLKTLEKIRIDMNSELDTIKINSW